MELHRMDTGMARRKSYDGVHEDVKLGTACIEV